MVWQRPVATTGDTSTARQRAEDPGGWRLADTVVDGLAEVIAVRRDVRRFRAEPVPDPLLRQVLAAGHAAPSVGHSQPWRFLVVRSVRTRTAAAVMADRERLRQAAAMQPEAARHLLALRLEGLREAPVGVVLCCDRRARAAGVLGRATFPDADLWSCAAAVQNMWLTARALGLGLGWVTLFDPDELRDLLSLPPGVETLGWLCLGWPDERPPEPGLERAGWSRRVPLDDVILHERWPAAEAPAPPPDHAATAPDPAATGPDPAPARVRARDGDDTLLAVPGALGLLGDLLVDLDGAGTDRSGGTLVIAAADHPVTRHGVSAYPGHLTGTVAAALSAGQALGAVAARTAGLELTLVDAGVDAAPGEPWLPVRPLHPRGDLLHSDALHPRDAARLLDAGERLGRRLAARGPVAIGEVGIGNTTVAAALAAALTGVPVDEVCGRGAGSDSAGIARKQAVVAGALARAGAPPRALDRPALVALLAALGGGEASVLSGVVLGACRAGAAVVLDGLLTGVVALAALRHDPAIRSTLVAGHRSTERGHTVVLRELGLEPVLDLRLRAGEGVGAALAVGVLRQGDQLRRQAARTG